MTKEEVEKLIIGSLNMLVAEDTSLNIERVGERTLAARIAKYLDFLAQKKDTELNADAEYNIVSDGQKKALNADEELKKAAQKAGRVVTAEGLVNVVPDIVVHKRNCNEKNLIVIEVKLRKASAIEIEYAKQKLRVFKIDPLSYSHAVLLSLPDSWEKFVNHSKIQFF